MTQHHRRRRGGSHAQDTGIAVVDPAPDDDPLPPYDPERYTRVICGIAQLHWAGSGVPTGRFVARHVFPDCRGCREPGDMKPPHRPSPHCQSGGRAHCTCPVCWG